MGNSCFQKSQNESRSQQNKGEGGSGGPGSGCSISSIGVVEQKQVVNRDKNVATAAPSMNNNSPQRTSGLSYQGSHKNIYSAQANVSGNLFDDFLF